MTTEPNAHQGPPTGDLPELLNEKQVAAYLDVTVYRVQMLRQSGELPCIALGKNRHFRFTREHIATYLENASTRRTPTGRPAHAVSGRVPRRRRTA